MADKDDKAYVAKLAEQAERYDEMVESMKGIAQMGVGLSQEERNLLSVAYKNVIGSRRSSWRIVNSILEQRKEKHGNEYLDLAKNYRISIEKELHEICNDILDLLEKDLIPTVSGTEESTDSGNHEAFVFYCKMKGDYLRYLAEFTYDSERNEASEKALVAYKHASERAVNHLKPTHPIRLGLALNFSVFYYEILQSAERACRLAKNAFDDAVTELDGLSEDNYKDSTLIMQLLRDNLTLWTQDMENAQNDKMAVQDADEQEQEAT